MEKHGVFMLPLTAVEEAQLNLLNRKQENSKTPTPNSRAHIYNALKVL